MSETAESDSYRREQSKDDCENAYKFDDKNGNYISTIVLTWASKFLFANLYHGFRQSTSTTGTCMLKKGMTL